MTQSEYKNQTLVILVSLAEFPSFIAGKELIIAFSKVKPPAHTQKSSI